MRDYYVRCPWSYKYQLVDFFTKRYPSTPKSRYQKMSKKQLYAMWYNIAGRSTTYAKPSH